MTMGAPELRINLGSLKRQDPYIDKIIDSSSQVAIYSFSPQRNEWEKTEVEGALFVYKRVAPPYWGFTIMNRLSMENLTEPLASELEFQTQNPFLLYRNAKLLIYGIWFYDQEDCKRIGELLQRLCLESDIPTAEISNLQKAKFFAGGDADPVLKGSVIKSSSPASNSANSISPGSSVGGVMQQNSNGDADSECDDKDVPKSKNNRSGVDILDLLSKAQDKFEKEKRSTPDPANDGLKGSSRMSPTVPENFLVKPVPVKPGSQQKLDVAALFKQHHPAGLADSLPVNRIGNSNGIGALHHMRINNPYHSLKTMPQMIPGSATINPTHNIKARQLGRSQSMTEVAMRKHMDMPMSGSVLSVEEVEKGLSQSATATSPDDRQQHVNSMLDKLIDRINSGQALSAASQLPRVATLPILSEVAVPAVSTNFIVSGAGSHRTVASTQAKQQDDDVFTNNNMQTPASFSVRPFYQSLPKARPSVHRSMSSSALPSGGAVPTSVSANFPFKSICPIPRIPNNVTVCQQEENAEFRLTATSASLHGVGAIGNNTDSSIGQGQTTHNAVSVTNASKMSKNKISEVPMISKVSNNSTPTTLISPEDFERSATTPQKTLELKQRLLDAPKANIIRPTTPDPLTKSQLQSALITLLQKDDTFLSAIHDVYLTSFEQLSS